MIGEMSSVDIKKRYSPKYLFSRATRIRTWKMTESESVALPFGDSPSFYALMLFAVSE